MSLCVWQLMHFLQVCRKSDGDVKKSCKIAVFEIAILQGLMFNQKSKCFAENGIENFIYLCFLIK